MTTRYVTGWGRVNAIGWILAVFVLGINGIAAAAEKGVEIVALGTSLTQGFNLPPGTDFTAVLQARLRARGHDVSVMNAGVSGDTSAGALARLDWGTTKADAVIVETGSNDALRGLDVAETRKNIDAILAKLKARGIPILLTGMKSPRNLGNEYVTAFDAIYPELAKKHGVLFYPFFLEGIAADLKLNQQDGIHPNEQGTLVIVRGLLPKVEELIVQIKAKHPAAAVSQ